MCVPSTSRYFKLKGAALCRPHCFLISLLTSDDAKLGTNENLISFLQEREREEGKGKKTGKREMRKGRKGGKRERKRERERESGRVSGGET